MRELNVIAMEIHKDWKKPYFGAVPYIHAMLSLSTLDDEYGVESATSMVRYFLANAGSWRGDTARRTKAELKAGLANR